jgi:hypothetical protein
MHGRSCQLGSCRLFARVVLLQLNGEIRMRDSKSLMQHMCMLATAGWLHMQTFAGLCSYQASASCYRL